MSLLIFSLMALSIPDRRVLRSLIITVSENHSVMSDSLPPHGLYRPRNSPGQNTGVGSLSLLQRIFPTQELNQGFMHCRRILYKLSYQGSPILIGRYCRQKIQGIFPTQGSNPGFPHCRWILYELSHQESPIIIVDSSISLCSSIFLP